MRLVYYELKKLSGQKLIIWLLVTMLVASSVIAFSFTERDETYFYLEKISEDYKSNPEAVDEYYRVLDTYDADFAALMHAYVRGEIPEEPVLEYPCTYSGKTEYDDYILLREFYDTFDNNENFSKALNIEINRAEVNKREILTSYEGITEESFAYRKQVLVADTYTDILGKTELLPQNGYGWDQFFGNDAVNVFIAVLVVIGTSFIFLSEKGNAALILLPAKRGRAATAAAKLAASFTWSSFVVILFLLTSFLSVLFKCGGMSDINNYVAVFDSMMFLPYALTIPEYLFVFVLSKLLLFITVAAICALLCLAVRNMTFGFLLSFGFIGINYLVYLGGDAAKLRYINLAGYACNSTMLSVLHPVNLFGYAVDAFPLMTVLLFVFAVLCGGSAVLLFSVMRLGTEKVSVTKLFLRLKSRFTDRKIRQKPMHCHGTGIFSYEAYKLFGSRLTVIAVTLILLIGVVLTVGTYKSKSSYQMLLYREYTDRLSGVGSDEKTAYINGEYEKINDIIENFDDKRAAFFSGEMNYTEYDKYLKDYAYASERSEIIEKLKTHSEYLTKTEEKTGISACYLYDIDWERLLSEGINIFLIIATAFIASGIFADEYGRGSTINIVRATKRGRKHMFTCKLCFSAITSFAVALGFTLLEWILIIRNFRLENGEYPLLSLEMFGNTRSGISINNFIIVQTVVRILLITAVCVAVTALGALLKNKLYTLAVSFLAIFAPNVIVTLGIRQLRYADMTNALDFTRLYLLSTELGGNIYLTLFISGIILICASVVIFAAGRHCKT